MKPSVVRRLLGSSTWRLCGKELTSISVVSSKFKRKKTCLDNNWKTTQEISSVLPLRDDARTNTSPINSITGSVQTIVTRGKVV